MIAPISIPQPVEQNNKAHIKKLFSSRIDHLRITAALMMIIITPSP